MSPDKPRLTLPAAPTAVRLFSGTVEELKEKFRRDREQRSFDRGHRAGQEDARMASCALLEQATAKVEAELAGAQERIAHTAVELALEITRQLMRHSILQGDYDIERFVRESLTSLSTERGSCVVHVHPEDHEALRDCTFRSGTRLEADTAVRRGDVHVETAMGLLVRELDDLLAAVGDRLRSELS